MTVPVTCPWCGDKPGGCLMCPGVGEQRRDAGMHRVASAEIAWSHRAYEWVLHLPHGATFNADDLIREVGRPDHYNAIGANFAAWAKARLIAHSGWVQATHAAANARQIQQWYRL